MARFSQIKFLCAATIKKKTPPGWKRGKRVQTFNFQETFEEV